MKKFLFISFILFSVICKAQTDKGRILLSGNTNASIFHYEAGNNVSNIKFASTIGFFAVNNLAIGLYGNIQTQLISNYYGSSNQTVYEVAPFIRFYIPQKSQILKPYFEFEGGISGYGKKNGRFFSGSIGLSIFLNQYVSFDPAFAIVNSKWESTSVSNTTIGFNIGISVFLGKAK